VGKQKLTIGQVKSQIEQCKYTLLSQDYKNNSTKLDIQCSSGHQYQATWTNFQQGYRCPYCSRKRVTYQQVKEQVEQQGYALLSKYYRNSRTKLDIRCDKGHQYQTSWGCIRLGCKCPYCIGKIVTHQQIKEYIEQQNYTLLSEHYKNNHTKLDIQCPEGHQYKVKWNDFKSGYRCPYCAKRKIDYQQIKEYIEQQNYILLSKGYKNALTKLDIRCPKGHQYQARWNDFQQGNRCPRCNESKGERRISQILESLNISFVRQYRLEKGKPSLKLDFYIPSLNLGIEYDGLHHFEPVCFGGMSLERAIRSFEEQQKRDRKKERLCYKNGWNLVRIRYDESLNVKTIKSKIQNYTNYTGAPTIN
jgi:rubredoxin